MLLDDAEIDGRARLRLHQILRGAFPQRFDLEKLVAAALDEDLDELVSDQAPLGEAVFRVIEAAQARGLLGALFEEAARVRPDVDFLQQIVSTGKPPASDDPPAPPPTLGRTVAVDSVGAWYKRLAAASRATGRLETPVMAANTWCLAPRLLVAARHTVTAEIEDPGRWTAVRATFDESQEEGPPPELSPPWVAVDLPDLDLVVLLAGFEVEASPLKIRMEAPEPGEMLWVVNTVGAVKTAAWAEVLKVEDGRAHLRTTANPGMSGAPVIDVDGRVVATAQLGSVAPDADGTVTAIGVLASALVERAEVQVLLALSEDPKPRGQMMMAR